MTRKKNRRNKITSYKERISSLRGELKTILKNGNLGQLKNYMNKNNISVKDYIINKRLNLNFDILEYAIRNNSSFDIINYIIDYYDDINNTVNGSSLLFDALSHHRFDVIDLLHEQNVDDLYLSKQNLEKIFLPFDYEIFKYLINNDISFSLSRYQKIELIKNFISYPDNHLTEHVINKYMKNTSIKIGKYSTDELEFNDQEFYHIYSSTFINNNDFALNLILEKDYRSEDKKLETIFKCFVNNFNSKIYLSFEDYYNKKIENKTSFINKISNQYSRKKIEDYFEDKLILDHHKKTIINIFKNKGSLSQFKSYIKDNNIDLNTINSNIFDLLIIAIEYQVSIEIIDYISDRYDLKNINKGIEFPFINNGNKFFPIVMAIVNNNFDVVNLLLKKGANINIEQDIIALLYDKQCLDCKNLKFILNHGYIMKINDYYYNYMYENLFLSKWIKNGNLSFLELFIKLYDSGRKYSVVSIRKFCKIAIEENNYPILFLLYRLIKHDDRGKYIKLYSFYHYINANYRNKFLTFLKNNQKPFKDLDFYCNSKYYNKEEDDHYEYINETIYQELNEEIQNYFNTTHDKNIDHINKCINYLLNDKNGNEYEFENYLKENNIELNELNTPEFDILIFAIENNISDGIINYIIKDYQSRQINLNYFINKYYSLLNYLDYSKDYYYEKETTNKKIIKSLLFETPFISSVASNKFELADFILVKWEKRVDYDLTYSKFYDKYKSINHLIDHIESKSCLNTENLVYLLKNNKNIVKNFTEKLAENIKKKFHHDNSIDMDNLDDEKNDPDIYENNGKDKSVEYRTIMGWIKNSKNIFLEIYIYYSSLNKENELIIEDYYYSAFRMANLDTFLILLNYEHRNIKLILYKLYNNEINKFGYNSTEVLEKYFISYFQKNEDIKFKDKKLYINFNDKNNESKSTVLLNESKYKELKTEIDIYVKNMELKEKVKNIILKNGIDKTKFENFMHENNISIDNLNTPNFDVLIYAIESGLSNDIIKYIINQYKLHHGSFNYGIKIDKRNSNKIAYKKSYDPLIYQTPLLTSIGNNNFEIADLLLENGAIINYNNERTCYSDENNFIYHENNSSKNLNINHSIYPYYLDKRNFLNSKNLKYFIAKEYKFPLFLLKSGIYNDNNRENLIDTIFKQYHFDNDFILNILLIHYQNKVPLSENQLKQYISKERSKLINEEIVKWIDEKFLFEKDIIKSIFKYANDEEKNKYFKDIDDNYNYRYNYVYYDRYYGDYYYDYDRYYDDYFDRYYVDYYYY